MTETRDRIGLAVLAGLPADAGELDDMAAAARQEIIAGGSRCGFAHHYGLFVSSIGEDGDLIVLGHHSDFRAIAAMNQYSRTTIGLANIADSHGANYNDLAKGLQRAWAVDLVEQGGCGQCDNDTDCSVCHEVADQARYDGWYLSWRDPGLPGAFPITRLVV